MQQLHDHIQSTATTVLLSNLYAQAEERDEVVQLTAGVSNEDDVTLLLRLQQAQALEQQGVPDAALEAYRDALKSKSRNRELLKRARYQRAKLHLDKGRRAMAKRDIGRLYADDPNYRDVAGLLRTRA
jgi:tetratricopeptide (TPR) repeat protein